MRRVVSNTGPLLHLGEVEALTLLGQTGEVYIPRAVDIETAQQNPLWQTQKPAWIHVHTLTASYAMEAVAWQQAGLLDSGEAEAVALVRQINAHWLLTDDAAARLFAQSLGMEAHGSLGVVLRRSHGYLSPEVLLARGKGGRMKVLGWTNGAWVLAIILGLTGASCATQVTPDNRRLSRH